MSIRSILVHVDSTSGAAVRLACASALADEFQALLIGVGAEGFPPAVDYGFAGGFAVAQGEWLSLMREQIAADFKAAEQTFREAAAARKAEWREIWAEPAVALADTARAADLIITGGAAQRLGVPAYREVSLGELVLTSGRPVLNCPSAVDHLSTREVLVAWKDTREARRAVADALPLLRRAKNVLVAEICPEDDQDQAAERAADVAASLARHGVQVRSEAILRKTTTSDAILARAEADGAGLIVAGGYGHSRIGEWAFGGVTRTLLTQDKHFVLFSH